MRKLKYRIRDWLLVKLAGNSPVMMNCTVRAPMMGGARGQPPGFALHNLVIGENIDNQRLPEIAASFFAFKGVGLDWMQAHPEFVESGHDVALFQWPWPEDDRGLH